MNTIQLAQLRLETFGLMIELIERCEPKTPQDFRNFHANMLQLADNHYNNAALMQITSEDSKPCR